MHTAGVPAILTLYVPSSDRSGIDPGSGVVGVATGDWISAYFEGNRFGYANVTTWADRCRIAYERCITCYPTVARRLFRPADLVVVGTFDGARITLTDGAAAVVAAQWLGTTTVAPDELHLSGH